MSFFDTVARAKSYLREHDRVSLRGLKREFNLDDDVLDELIEELVDVQQVATREGNVLVWATGNSAAVPTAEVELQPTPTTVAEGERRQLTVMFCDLVGSTDLSQRLDAEDLRNVVRAYQEAASAAIERYEGHIAQYLGDGLLVYFGYPQAHENDAERAVRAGLEILAALASLNGTLEREQGIRLAARVGVHTGPVVVGEIGSGANSEMLALGDTTNIAARLEGTADPDSVMISAATLRLVAGMFVVEDRGPQVLKGVREPLTIYRVVRPSGVRSRLEVAAGRLTRFVGRDVELATLVDRWERAQDGEGQTVVVFGEAGLGKSRLVYQLHEHLGAVPHTWLECGAAPYTTGTPFHPVIALVAQGLAFAPEDSAADKLGKVETGLGTLASEESVALLAAFLGLPPPTPLQLSQELQRRKTIDLLVHWNLTLSATQPLVLFIEDLHWCDMSTLELFGNLLAQSPTARLMLLATTRPELALPWPARENLTTVQLARLTKRQARDMVVTVAGTELPADTVDALIARAGGVPLYVEELTKAIAEPGAGQCVEAIPATLADSLMARLDRLSAAKEVAQRAAVLGREFGYPLVAAIADMDEAALRQGLTRLVDAEILFARGEPPAAKYTFKHALIQETAYQSLLKRARQELHARVAQVLEERFPERVESEPEVVARHYEQAGLAALAITHYQRAGERATQRSANEEAITHLRRALELLESLPESGERDQRELGLQIALGVPLTAARGWSHPEKEQAYARARELASRIGESPELPRALMGMAVAYHVKGDLLTAAELGQEAMTAAQRTGLASDLVPAHAIFAPTLVYQGEFLSALPYFEQGIGLYEPSTHGPRAYTVGFDGGVIIRAHAALCHFYLGYPDRARAMGDEAVALGKKVDHPLSLADALCWGSGVVHLECGEHERTRERNAEAEELAVRLGFPAYLGWGKFLRGWIDFERGDRDAGVAEMQEALADLARIECEVRTPFFFSVLAESLCKLGRHDDALVAIERGHAQAEPLGQHFYDAELCRLCGVVLIDRDGDAVEEAERLFKQALEIARRQQAQTFELRAATSMGRLWQRQGKQDEARALLEPVYGWFTEGFDTRDLRDAKAVLEELA